MKVSEKSDPKMERQSSFKGNINYYSVDMNVVASSGKTRFAKNRHKRRSKTMPGSLPSLVRSDSFGSVRHLAKMFELKMSEGRKTQVILLDERKLEILIQPKLYAGELLDLVASHFSLKEKEYFGLSFKDDTGHHHWLQLDRKVLEHEFPKKASEPLLLFFCVRFFIESIGYLRDSATIELFFLQAKHSLYKGTLECDSETVFELAAHVLQSTYGDFTDEFIAKKQLQKLPVLPTSTLKEHPSLAYCEDKVIEHYKKLSGTSRGSALVNYMTIVESLPTYGIHYYEVKDKSGIPWWLGLSFKGISLYDYNDKRVPRKVFAWKQLENLYFRDKKFSIEVHDPKRVVHTLSSFNLYEDAIQESIEEFDDLSDAISDPTTQVSVSRRTFGPGNVNVHAWFASTPQLTKCIWSMAVSQHQFYLDRKQSKSQLPSVRSMSEIAADLGTSTTSLHSSGYSGGNISRSNSVVSLGQLSSHNSRTELTQEDIEESRQAQREMHSALKARKVALEEVLRKKTEDLKALCLKEAELTGELPMETPLTPGEPLPQIRRRIGTAFSLSHNNIFKDKETEEEELISKLELEYELQAKITEAALRLAKDHTVAKSVRKRRKASYHKASQKLKDIEKKLNDYRKHKGKIPVQKNYNSADELSEDSREFLDSDNEFLSPVNSPQVNRHDTTRGQDHYMRGQGQVRVISSPHVEVVEMDPVKPRPVTPSSQGLVQRSGSPSSQGRHPQQYSHGISRGSTPSPGPQRHYVAGERYTPSTVYNTKTLYRNQSYPTFNQHQGGGGGGNNHGNHSDYENSNNESGLLTPNSSAHLHQQQSGIGGATGVPPQSIHPSHQDYVHNMYNLSLNSTSRYESSDELKSPSYQSESYDSFPQDRPPPLGRGIPRTNSFESSHNSSVRSGIEPYRPYNNVNNYPPGPDRHMGLPHRQDDELSEISISELTPSRFGSKRDSHTDHRDSPYYTSTGESIHHRKDLHHHHQYYPSHNSGAGGNSNVNSLGGEIHYQHQQQNSHTPYSDHNSGHTADNNTMAHSPSAGYGGYGGPQQQRDHSGGLRQQALPSTPQFDQSGGLRQQAPPSTPQFESPPPHFIRQDPPLPHNNYTNPMSQAPPPHYHPSQSQQQQNLSYTEYPEHSQHPPQPHSASSTQQKPVAVTKYSKNYVEVSKPFEMADVYKYSEKIRKQRFDGDSLSSGQTSPSHSSSGPLHSSSAASPANSSSASSVRVNSPYLQRATHMPHNNPPPAPPPRSRSESPSLQEPHPQQIQHHSGQQGYSTSSSSHYGHMPTYQQHSQQSNQQQHQTQHHQQQGYGNSSGGGYITTQQHQYHQSPQYSDNTNNQQHRSINDPENQSFGSFQNDSVSRAFSQEMLEWYEDQDSMEAVPQQTGHCIDSSTLV